MQLHVSPHGDDRNPGTAEAPLATLGRARDVARGYPDTLRGIILRGGRHVTHEPVVFGPEDSGLTVEAAAGEAPMLYGGRTLTDWSTKNQRLWSAPVRQATTGEWDFRQLYVNGQARPRARLPESGTWQHASTFDQQWLSTTGGGFQPPPSLELRSTMVYREGQLPADFSTRNAEFVILHSWDESQTRAVHHDPDTRTLALDPPCTYPPGAFLIADYCVLNLREGMTRPGQWYLDLEQGLVVYWPLPGEDPNDCTIEAPVAHTLLQIEGRKDEPVRDLTLLGFGVDLTGVSLGAPQWGAMPFAGAVVLRHVCGCRLQDLTVSRAGGQGIKIIGADDTVIERCTVTNTGANGIIFRDGSDNAIVSTRVSGTGQTYPSGCGINAGNLRRSRICGNEVSDCSYCGIALGDRTEGEEPQGNVIERNHVWDVMKALDDGGCLYVTSRGTMIRDNLLHGSQGRTGFGMGLYLDEQARDIVCEGNLVYDVGRFPLLVHMAMRNTVRNNVFVCGPGREMSFRKSRDCLFAQNIVYAPDTGIEFTDPQGARFVGNLYYPGDHDMTWWPEPEPLIADPQFVAPERGDFRLQEGSPAFRIGFRPLSV